MNKRVSLEEIAAQDTNQVFELTPPFTVEMTFDEHPSPALLKNLSKLKKLGVLTPEAIFSIVAQAPIDPVNLMATLYQIQPTGWTFSAVDFSMFRVLSHTPKKAVAAALRVDLMGGEIAALVLNQANQLTVYKTLEVQPRSGMLDDIQKLCDDAVAAAKRETKTQT